MREGCLRKMCDYNKECNMSPPHCRGVITTKSICRVPIVKGVFNYTKESTSLDGCYERCVYSIKSI